MATDQFAQNGSSRRWIAIALVVLAVGLFCWYLFRQRTETVPEAEPTPSAQNEYVAPVLEPEVETIKELAEITKGRPIPEVTNDRSIGWIIEDDYFYGELGLPITIIEYANLSNQYAKLMHPELIKLVDENPEINWIFRHYPLAQEPLDMTAAIISECVAQQFIGEQKGFSDAMFFEYIGLVFEKGFESEEELLTLVEDLGIARGALELCMQDPNIEDNVLQDKRFGFVYGKVELTPTFFFVDNLDDTIKVLDGADSIEFVKEILTTM